MGSSFHASSPSAYGSRRMRCDTRSGNLRAYSMAAGASVPAPIRQQRFSAQALITASRSAKKLSSEKSTASRSESPAPRPS